MAIMIMREINKSNLERLLVIRKVSSKSNFFDFIIHNSTRQVNFDQSNFEMKFFCC